LTFKARLTLVTLIVLVMFVLHNSFWLWGLDDRIPLLFGFMPFAYSFYVGYAILAVVAMKLIIQLAWPDPPTELVELVSDKEPDQS
jgi:hypothetical protein